MREALLILSLSLLSVSWGFCPCIMAFGFQSDELLVDDDEFGLEGGRSHREFFTEIPSPQHSPPSTVSRKLALDPEADSKLRFTLEHAFGDSDFVPAGTFSARLKTWNHGEQTLTKLRFSRDVFNNTEEEMLRKVLKDDQFYKIRLPSNVVAPPGREFIVSSVKARCLSQESLDEHFTIHMEGVNIIAVNYGSPGACQYPRPLKIPRKWSFISRTILKSSEQAPRTPAFAEDVVVGDVDGEGVKAPERSFWAKYWMYLIPLGLIIMNAVTQAMNMPEEQQAAARSPQQPVAAIQRGQSAAARRR